MIPLQRLSIAFCISMLMPLCYANEAPVVDATEVPAYSRNDNAAPLAAQADAQQPLVSDSDSSLQTQDVTPRMATSSADNASNNSPGLLLQKIQNLQQQVQQLQGKLEVQQHDIARLEKQNQAYYKDLDSRITALSNGGVKTLGQAKLPTAATNTVPTTAKLPMQNEQQAYHQAYQLIQAKQFDAAMLSMQQLLTQYPNGNYSANAHYWLGELYLAKKNTAKASEEFNTVITQYSNSNKVAPAMLKLGFAQAESGDTGKARQTLMQVKQQFPDTNSALLAQSKLQLLDTDKT